jgi:hypothetical protein
MIIDFGYLKPIKVGNQDISTLKIKSDNTTVSILKSYISQKASEIDESGNKGKANPFLP